MTSIEQMSSADFLMWVRGFIHGLNGGLPTKDQWDTICRAAFVQTDKGDALAEFTED